MRRHFWKAVFFTGFICLIARPGFADVQIGEKAPDFKLVAIEGQFRSLSEFQGKYVVLEWLNFDCPYIQKHYDSGNMQKLQKEYTEKGVVWLSICSSAPGKQGYYSLEEWNQKRSEKGASPTTILIDYEGTTGKAYGAKTTPHMFIINPEGNVIYQGAIDNDYGWDPAGLSGAKNYVKAALDSAMAGGPVEESSTPSYGCSVKY